MLAESPPPNSEVILADRPGAGLVELLEGAEAVILIDAMHSGARPGTIREFAFDELPGAMRLVSSHDLGVAAAIRLAQKLGRGPSVGKVIGIEIAPTSTEHFSELGDQMRDVLAQAAARVRSLAAEFDERRLSIPPAD